MEYPESKIYYDGSHYIAIPHSEKRHRKRIKRKTEEVIILQNRNEIQTKSASTLTEDVLFSHGVINEMEGVSCLLQSSECNITTRKELFETGYTKTEGKRKSERKEQISGLLMPYFNDEEEAENYVEQNLERKRRNLISRRIRMTRKANLQEFNYFCTFTYDNRLHTEESFRKRLKSCLSSFATRKNWRYIGVWERSPERERLHFHGIFYIPEGTVPGEILPFRDYDTRSGKMRVTWQSLYFNERFGRSDFEEIKSKNRIGEALAYLMKYLEKSGERIVYSKGLPQYFISDISEEDVVCRVGVEDRKLLLYDDFCCYDDGKAMGKVTKNVIRKLRKSN